MRALFTALGTVCVAIALTSCGGGRAPEPPSKPLSFKEGERASTRALSHQPGYDLLQSIPAVDLFSYVSGYYLCGHSFPALYFDPKTKTFTVTNAGIRQSYPAAELDKALESYRTVLIAKGYEIAGTSVDTNHYIWVNGKQLVYVNLADLFPDPGPVKSHFTAAQYDYIYSKLDGWGAFSYLAGLGGDPGRDYPLVVALGYKQTARLRVLSKDVAREFTFDQLDAAFAAYRAVATRRVAQ